MYPFHPACQELLRLVIICNSITMNLGDIQKRIDEEDQVKREHQQAIENALKERVLDFYSKSDDIIGQALSRWKQRIQGELPDYNAQTQETHKDLYGRKCILGGALTIFRKTSYSSREYILHVTTQEEKGILEFSGRNFTPGSNPTFGFRRVTEMNDERTDEILEKFVTAVFNDCRETS